MKAIEDDGKGSRVQKNYQFAFLYSLKTTEKTREIARQSITEENEHTLTKRNQLKAKYSENNSLS